MQGRGTRDGLEEMGRDMIQYTSGEPMGEKIRNVQAGERGE